MKYQSGLRWLTHKSLQIERDKECPVACLGIGVELYKVRHASTQTMSATHISSFSLLRVLLECLVVCALPLLLLLLAPEEEDLLSCKAACCCSDVGCCWSCSCACCCCCCCLACFWFSLNSLNSLREPKVSSEGPSCVSMLPYSLLAVDSLHKQAHVCQLSGSATDIRRVLL